MALGSASMAAWRASAWATTTIPASAARPARIHHPTAWGWIEESIALASVSRSSTDQGPERLCLGLEPGKIGCAVAEPDEIRGKGTVFGLTILAKAWVVYRP